MTRVLILAVLAVCFGLLGALAPRPASHVAFLVAGWVAYGAADNWSLYNAWRSARAMWERDTKSLPFPYEAHEFSARAVMDTASQLRSDGVAFRAEALAILDDARARDYQAAEREERAAVMLETSEGRLLQAQALVVRAGDALATAREATGLKPDAFRVPDDWRDQLKAARVAVAAERCEPCPVPEDEPDEPKPDPDDRDVDAWIPLTESDRAELAAKAAEVMGRRGSDDA